MHNQNSEDIIVQFEHSMLHHGPKSNRIYLMKLSNLDYPHLIGRLAELAKSNHYTKIFAKVPAWALIGFQEYGYVVEAEIAGFFNGEIAAYFMAFYLDSARAQPCAAKTLHQVAELALSAPLVKTPPLPEAFRFAILSSEHVQELTEVYRQVFETYPFPIFSADYIEQTMQNHVIYFGIYFGDKLIAVSSSEMDLEGQNAEMTDFATLPDYRSKGLASFLLEKMEREMKSRHILTVFATARALSFGMNLTFARHGYAMGGTLINNTDIGGAIESMNVWHKGLG